MDVVDLRKLWGKPGEAYSQEAQEYGMEIMHLKINLMPDLHHYAHHRHFCTKTTGKHPYYYGEALSQLQRGG